MDQPDPVPINAFLLSLDFQHQLVPFQGSQDSQKILLAFLTVRQADPNPFSYRFRRMLQGIELPEQTRGRDLQKISAFNGILLINQNGDAP
ncbi:hypothetical protein SDC9_176740 [bioreactor metagenome]|uniref:Uncharacterized protein n=1 Tax=bioreactor metagenome TaxID=1076179 RepID=A0A645GQX1_9ZZZZ